jgi:hypothetical protein
METRSQGNAREQRFNGRPQPQLRPERPCDGAKVEDYETETCTTMTNDLFVTRLPVLWRFVPLPHLAAGHIGLNDRYLKGS